MFDCATLKFFIAFLLKALFVFKFDKSTDYDIINKETLENLINLFTHFSDIHQYATQSSTSNNLFTKPSRPNLQLNSFSRIGVRLWNSIPGDIRVMSKRSFKKYLPDHLFSTLESEDHYFDVSESIHSGFLKTEIGSFLILHMHAAIHLKFKYKSTRITISLVFFFVATTAFWECVATMLLPCKCVTCKTLG